MLIPLLTVVAGSIVGVLSWVWNGFGAGDAVGQAARSVARGENQWVVHQQLQSMMPDANIYWSVGESTVRVRVERWEYISTAVLGEHWQKVVQEATAPIEGAQG